MKNFSFLWKNVVIFLLITFVSDLHASKTALVTGGAGFLGSHMCEKLLKNDYDVICLDYFVSGKLNNISHLLKNPHFRFIEHDVEKFYDPGFTVDEIYNFACPASPSFYQANAVKTLLTNVLGAINMLEIARKYDSKIFQASTSEIYGDPLEHPQKETYWGNVNPIGIRSCYDEGKRCAETLFFDYNRLYDLKIKVARIFNTYGPGMRLDDGRVISNFLVQALKNDPITIYGEGLQSRSFCYVDDLIEAIFLFMHTSDDITGPLNLGNPDEFTVIELAEKIIKLTNSSSVLKYEPLPSDDPKRRKPDITLATEFLSWSPKISLDEGLKRTCAYFTQHLEH